MQDNRQSKGWRGQTEPDIQISVKGLPDNLADRLGGVVLKAAEKLEQVGGGLDLRRMHRMVVTTDFAGELAELSAARVAGNPITYTNEEYGIAIAKVLLLPRGEDYEIVPVVNANYVLELLVPEGADEGAEGAAEAPQLSETERLDLFLHGLHHELCHVHDDNKRIDAFGTLMLSPYYSGKDAYIRPLAEACWAEYIADFMSSPTADAVWLGVMTNSFGNAIERTKRQFNNEILAYRVHHIDLGQLLDSFQRHGVFLAKSAAYILGYVDGLDASLELSAETSERLSGSYFESTWDAMHEALREMRQRYPHDWQDLSIYDGLAAALEHYYVEMGLVLPTTDDGQTYVHVPFTPETTP